MPTSTPTAAASASKGDPVISIAGFTFYDEQDVKAWIDTYLPPNCPFGPFVDIYGFLARFVTQKSSGLAKDMEGRAKVYITTSEEILL